MDHQIPFQILNCTTINEAWTEMLVRERMDSIPMWEELNKEKIQSSR